MIDELHREASTSLINSPGISQPATTAIQIGLVSLLSAWGVSPAAVVGHSRGEIAAAYAAGALSLAHCMRVAYYRGVLAEVLKGRRAQEPGSMLAIGATEPKVQSMIKASGATRAVIACVNAPSLMTVSGDVDAIAKIETEARREEFLVRRLKVDVAYHSHHMQDISAEYRVAIKTIEALTDPSKAFHSSVDGRRIDTSCLDADYWVRNMTSPVQFLDAVSSMHKESRNLDLLIEIGPHSALESPIKDIFKGNPDHFSNVRYLPTLIRNQDAELSMLSLVSRLHNLGFNLDFEAVNRVNALHRPQLLDGLPSYPWNHSRRHWHDTRLDTNHRFKKFPRSDLLGSLVDDFTDKEPRWRNIIRLSELPWLAHHVVQQICIMPFAGYLAMVIEATLQQASLQGKDVLPSTIYRFRHVQVNRPMVISENEPVETSLVIRPREEGSRISSKIWNEFSISSWTSEGGWVDHCHGLIALIFENLEEGSLNGRRHMEYEQKSRQELIEKCEKICTKHVAPTDIYDSFARGGLVFGPAFRNVTSGRATRDHSICTISVPVTARHMPNGYESVSVIHPGTLDACFQPLICAAHGGEMFKTATFVPTFIEEMDLRHGLLPYVPGQEMQVFAIRSRPLDDTDSSIHASFLALRPDLDSRVCLEIKGWIGTTLPNDMIDKSNSGDRRLCYQTVFEPLVDMMTSTQFAQSFQDSQHSPRVLARIEELERAAFYYIQKALDERSGRREATCDGHLERLHQMLLHHLELGMHGSLKLQTPAWLASSELEKEKFLEHVAASNPCGPLLCSIGENYTSILDEEVAPLSIMLRDNMPENYYDHNESTKGASEPTIRMLQKMTHQNPKMRIIEVGAGTGSQTRPSLQGLGRSFSQYDLTDISAGFFQKAKEDYRAWGEQIQYKRLNIEDDPVSQGFEAGSYDLVIAANVLHATANLSNTLRNVRTLLKPGGKILNLELTESSLSGLFIFGTLPGRNHASEKL